MYEVCELHFLIHEYLYNYTHPHSIEEYLLLYKILTANATGINITECS